MSKLPLTIAVSRYDHVNDVLTGAVPVEGIDLNPLDLPLHDIFFRFIHFKDFDVAELSMAKYVSMISQGDDSLIALPAFPSRVPRHSSGSRLMPVVVRICTCRLALADRSSSSEIENAGRPAVA